MMNIAALSVNLMIVLCEAYVLFHIKGKLNILKYYTYLQNLIALVASLIFCVCVVSSFVLDGEAAEFARGVRYIAACGLVLTTFIFVVFLGAGKKISITDDDFLHNFSAKKANALLHYILPAASLISFLLLERDIPLTDGIWTATAALPSCIYWVIYLILSLTKRWDEPYDLTSSNGGIGEFITVLLIPLSFIAVSFILWNIK